jgi:hypothetical protein
VIRIEHKKLGFKRIFLKVEKSRFELKVATKFSMATWFFFYLN